MQKTKKIFTIFLTVFMLVFGLTGCGTAEDKSNSNTVMDYTNNFVGTWEADFSDFDVYVEQGITGVAKSEFDKDGNLTTYLDGKKDGTFGYFVYKDYYVAIGEDGSAEVTQYKFSDNGSTLEFSDLEGNWMLTYTKTK